MIQEFFRGISDLIHGTTPTPVPPARRMILLVIVGTLPLFAILGIKDWIESLSSNLYVVGGALIVTGCLLFASDRVRKGRKNEHSARMTDALIVGAAQALATCPGLSRSGTTISVGCFLGFERKFAVRYSFIMSIPAVLGANILSLKDALGGEVIWKDVPVYLLGVLVAAVVGYACILAAEDDCGKGKIRSLCLLLLGSRSADRDFDAGQRLSEFSLMRSARSPRLRRQAFCWKQNLEMAGLCLDI